MLHRLEDRTAPAAGALDPTFGVGGRVTTRLTTYNYGHAIAIDHLGRYVVAGYSIDGSLTNERIMVTRYTVAGSLDPSFGGTGIVSVGFGLSGTIVASAGSVAVDSQNRVLVVGNTGNDVAVIRLTSAGALDTTFNGDGRQRIDFGGYDNGSSVAIDSLDRALIAAYTTIGQNSIVVVARLTVAGALDSSFGNGGRQTISFGAASEAAYAVAVDSLDRVVVAGDTGSAAAHDFAIARLTMGGVLDISFDGDGKQTIDFHGDEFATAVAVDAQDRVVVAGGTNVSYGGFALARLTVSGALDASFDGDGKQIVEFGMFDSGAESLAIDSFGRVVAGGAVLVGDPDEDFAALRLTAGGALDTTFGVDGKQIVGFGTFPDVAFGVAVDTAGRTVLAGYASQSGGPVFALARLTGDTTTASAQVNDGSAQRSRVTSLTIRFSGQVTFSAAPADAFTLVRTGGGAVNFTANVSVEFGGTVVVLNNFTGPETDFGSLRDGRYTLTALASQISAGGQALDGDANGTPGGDFVFGDQQGLFRFFGDINGDRHVDIADFALFSSSFNLSTGQTGFLAAFDFNNDGHIDIADFGQFSIRFFTVLP
jgi:uncharacterized delta-60 repeat protein